MQDEGEALRYVTACRLNLEGVMIRLIVKVLSGDYDGVTHQSFRTFDVDLPEVEKFLSENTGYMNSGSKNIIGGELIKTDGENNATNT